MATIFGTDGPDSLQGTVEADVINGLAGDDEIRGGAGRDELYGGDGNDRLDGTGGTFSGSITDAVLSGGAGDDWMQPVTFGNTGNPANPPITLVDGGSGVDTVHIDTNLAMTIDLSDPSTPQTIFTYVNFPLQAYFGVTLINVERLEYRSSSVSFSDNITGGALNDVIFGGRADDILQGGGGDDILNGGDSGRDILLGGDGDDSLTLDLGDKLIDGGDGIDAIQFGFFMNPAGPLIFSLADPSAEQDLFGTTVRNVEYLSAFSYGTIGDDVVTGGAFDDVFGGWWGNDIIRGGGGNDHLSGHIGNDELHGETGSDILLGMDGNDLLEGGDGADRLDGGDGNDTLNGGTGADQLFGGNGADVFVFAPADLGLAYALRDKIHDFEVGVDLLDLSAFTDVGITLVHGANDKVKIDFDGDLKTDALIQVATVGGAALTMDDLLL